MKYKVHTPLVLVTIYMVLVQPLRSECPSADKINEQKLTCIGRYIAATEGSIKASAFKDYCDVRAETEIKCLEKMYNDCKTNAKVRQILDRTTNVTAIRIAIRTMCDNIDTLAAKEQCMVNEEPAVTKCTMASLAELQKTMTSMRNESQHQERIDNATCKYTRQMFDCQQRFGDKCGKDIQKILDTILQASNPNMCDRLPIENSDKISRNSAPNDSITSHYVFTGFLCFVTFVSYFCRI